MIDTHPKTQRPLARLAPLLVTLVCGGWASTSQAETGSGPCADDLARYCKDVQPGEGRMARCLKEHEHQVSPACRDNIAATKRKVEEIGRACETDHARLCKDAQPGGGRILNCLKAHDAELSAECKAKLQRPEKAKP